MDLPDMIFLLSGPEPDNSKRVSNNLNFFASIPTNDAQLLPGQSNHQKQLAHVFTRPEWASDCCNAVYMDCNNTDDNLIWIARAETIKKSSDMFIRLVRLQAKVGEWRIGLWPRLNTDPVCDDSIAVAAYAACSNMHVNLTVSTVHYQPVMHQT